MATKPSQSKPSPEPATAPPAASPPVASSRTAPGWVKVIAILYYISAALCVIGAIVLFTGAGFISTLLSQVIPAGLGIGPAVFIIAGVFLIIGAAIDFIIAFFLWKLKNWARIVTIVFSILGMAGALINLVNMQIVMGIISLIIDGFIAGYLLFSKEAKEAFG